MAPERAAAPPVAMDRAGGVAEALLVAAGGALGTLLRAALSALGGASPLAAVPGAATALINTIGALALAGVLAWLERRGPRPRWRAFLAVGLLGSFTTFSALVDESTRQGGSFLPSLPWIGGSLALGVGAFVVGKRASFRMLETRPEPARPAAQR